MDKTPIYTEHAKARFAERFPKLDIRQEYLKSTITGGGVKDRIKQSCQKHAYQWGNNFKGACLRRGKGKGGSIVFVVKPVDTVVTVLDLSKCGKK